jgi:hypothetical protein
MSMLTTMKAATEDARPASRSTDLGGAVIAVLAVIANLLPQIDVVEAVLVGMGIPAGVTQAVVGVISLCGLIYASVTKGKATAA